MIKRHIHYKFPISIPSFRSLDSSNADTHLRIVYGENAIAPRRWIWVEMVLITFSQELKVCFDFGKTSNNDTRIEDESACNASSTVKVSWSVFRKQLIRVPKSRHSDPLLTTQ